MDSSFSKSLGDKPTSVADLAETSPAGPPPGDRWAWNLRQETDWRTYNGDCPGHGLRVCYSGPEDAPGFVEIRVSVVRIISRIVPSKNCEVRRLEAARFIEGLPSSGSTQQFTSRGLSTTITKRISLQNRLLLLLHFLTFNRRSRSNNRYLQTDSGQRKSLLRLAVSPLLGCFLRDDETGEGTMDWVSGV